MNEADLFEPTPAEAQEYAELKQKEAIEQEQYFKQNNSKTMNTGTYTSIVARVENVEGDGQRWNGVYYHLLVMENGDKINLGKKKILEAGQEVSYEIVEVGQQEYCKAKSWNPEYEGKPQNNGAPKSNYQSKGGSNNASFALSYAKDCWNNGTVGTREDMFILADEMLTWLNSK